MHIGDNLFHAKLNQDTNECMHADPFGVELVKQLLTAHYKSPLKRFLRLTLSKYRLFKDFLIMMVALNKLLEETPLTGKTNPSGVRATDIGLIVISVLFYLNLTRGACWLVLDGVSMASAI